MYVEKLSFDSENNILSNASINLSNINGRALVKSVVATQEGQYRLENEIVELKKKILKKLNQ
jgi:hypothetical protein